MNKSNVASLPRRRATPSKAMPLDIGIIHFVGIGGIGMSGIAEILHNLGYAVSGSDIAENPNIERLRGMGVEVVIGHAAENVAKAAVVVKSTAVPVTNPEIIAARELQIPVVRRSEMLAELTHLKATIAVAGSHGKTTTTSLVAHMMECGKFDPTVINGGIINAYGTNAHLGKGDWLVAEVDESDGTFIKIPATIGVVTNLDPEHLDYWGGFDALKDAFKTFIQNLPFYGFAVLCTDHPEVKALAEKVADRRIITYGLESEDVDIYAVDIRSQMEGSVFDVVLSERMTGEAVRQLKDVELPVPGVHNISNALAAIAIGLELGISDKEIIAVFKSFDGVKRRFTKTGEAKGVTIIDDYGHHPVEIMATLAAARDVVGSKGKVIAVVQPHRYSRLEHLFKEFTQCFDAADSVIVSEVYAAGEQPIDGINRDVLVKALQEQGKDAYALGSSGGLAEQVTKLASKGDIVVCLGAGSITHWAHALPDALQKL